MGVRTAEQGIESKSMISAIAVVGMMTLRCEGSGLWAPYPRNLFCAKRAMVVAARLSTFMRW